MTADNQAQYKIGGDPEPSRHAHGMPHNDSYIDPEFLMPEAAPDPNQKDANGLDPKQLMHVGSPCPCCGSKMVEMSGVHYPGVLGCSNGLCGFGPVSPQLRNITARVAALERNNEALAQECRRLDRFTRDLEMRIAKQAFDIPMPDENSSAAEQEAKFNPKPKPKPAIPPLPSHPWFRMHAALSEGILSKPQFDMLGDGTGWHDIAGLIPRALEICCAVAADHFAQKVEALAGVAVNVSLDDLEKPIREFQHIVKSRDEWRNYLKSRTINL